MMSAPNLTVDLINKLMRNCREAEKKAPRFYDPMGQIFVTLARFKAQVQAGGPGILKATTTRLAKAREWRSPERFTGTTCLATFTTAL
jgi:hypothetical protein